MAELIGIVSGAITFATVVAQVTESIIAINDYCSQIRDAPHDLQVLLNELELFGLILADIEEDLSEHEIAVALSRSKHATKSLNLCKQAAEDLESIVKSLAQDFLSPGRMKKSYASVKTVLQRGKIERLKQRLQGAGQLLQLSQQCYTRALLQVQPELIAARLSPSHTAEPKLETQKQVKKLGVTPSKDFIQSYRWQTAYTWRLTLPSWMSSKALELAGARVPAGWNWFFRVYNLIPPNSKVLDLVDRGDIEGLQECFASKEASPFDRTSPSDFFNDPHFGEFMHGDMTLLHWAFRARNSEKVLSFLLEQGCDPMLGPSINGRSLPLSALEYGGLTVSRSQSENQFLRPLLQRSDDVLCDSETEVTEGIFKHFCGTPEDFLFLQQHCCPSFYTFPTRVRIEVAANIAYVSNNNAFYLPQTLRTVIGGDVRKLHVSDLDTMGARTPLFHAVMGQIGSCRAATQRYGYSNQNYILYVDRMKQAELLSSLSQDWNRLFCDLLDTGLNRHFMWKGKSPFVAFLAGYIDEWEFERCDIRDWNLAVQSWMRDLEGLGMDLLEFGRKETEAWKSDAMEPQLVRAGWEKRRDGCYWRLIGFRYGPRPDDWSLWMYEWNERFTDFWNLVERPIESMPGTWPGE